MTIIKDKTIVVWFSCGAASAVASKLIVDKYDKDNNVIIANCPVIEEDEDNLRFKADVGKWIGKEIVEVKNKKFPKASIVDVFSKMKYMSGIAGASCTLQLKKEARYQFEKKVNIDYHVLGFTHGEESRQERFSKYERENTIPILIENKITKGRCFEILSEAGVPLPRIYKLGFPNANCIGCVKSQSPTYWNLVREKFPKAFDQRAKQSRELGVRLVKYKGDRIYLDELSYKAKGGKIKSFDCGIFCDKY